MARDTGKRGGAVELDHNLAAPTTEGEKLEAVKETDTDNIPTVAAEMQIFDMYTVGYDHKRTAQPFVHRLSILAPDGKATHVRANFDDGALINAMSTAKFNKVKHLLGQHRPSSRLLRMADGTIVGALAVWEGEMEIEGVRAHGSFEVFDSGNNWEFLLGKPLLTAFNSIHEYKNDTVTIENKGLTATLKNQVDETKEQHKTEPESTTPERRNLVGNVETFPQREVHFQLHSNAENPSEITDTGNPNKTEPTPAHIIIEETDDDTSTTTEIEVDALKDSENIFTRHTDPWKKERVDKILEEVKIGPDLSETERGQVLTLLSEWADIFALSVSEVKHVENVVHTLDIPPGTTFTTKVNQKPLTPPQRKYLHESIDAMLEAGIIEQCSPDQVKCASPTVRATAARLSRN
jgi:hypothetical protein